jgi:hypothetical protein
MLEVAGVKEVKARQAKATKATTKARTMAADDFEEWVVGAMEHLAANDPDRARMENGVGFSAADGEFGHSLVRQYPGGGWTAKQWAIAKKMVVKYRRQVGEWTGSEGA